MRLKLNVQIEMTATDEDAASSLVHSIWEAGDPDDATKATIWVREVDLIDD